MRTVWYFFFLVLSPMDSPSPIWHTAPTDCCQIWYGSLTHRLLPLVTVWYIFYFHAIVRHLSTYFMSLWCVPCTATDSLNQLSAFFERTRFFVCVAVDVSNRTWLLLLKTCHVPELTNNEMSGGFKWIKRNQWSQGNDYSSFIRVICLHHPFLLH